MTPTPPPFITAWVATQPDARTPLPEAAAPQDTSFDGELTGWTTRNDHGDDLAELDLAGLKARRGALRDRLRKLLGLAERSWLSPGYRLKVVGAVERVADEIFAVGMELHRREHTCAVCGERVKEERAAVRWDGGVAHSGCVVGAGLL